MYIEDVFGLFQCHIQIRVDWDTIQRLGLEITIGDIRKAILANKKLKLKKTVRKFCFLADVRMSVSETTTSFECI